MCQQASSQKKRVKKRRFEGSRWGTAWKVDREALVVTWPTLYGAVPFGFFGLFFCGIVTANKTLESLSHGREWGYWLPALIVVGLLSSLLLASARLLRETFSLSSKKAVRSRWPAKFRPSQAVPKDQVLNAIVRLHVIHGKHTRRVGEVQVRVRYPDRIEWWHIGGSLSWGTSQSLGQALARYLDVRVERE